MSNSKTYNQQIKRPSWKKYLGEHFKVWQEIWRLNKFRKTYKPERLGDGHPVLMIPGFLGSDLSTGRIRVFLNKIGYETYGWELGRNYGNVAKLNLLEERLVSLHDKHQTEVSLVGWSLGGVYARQIAKANPGAVRQVITMGSPFAAIEAPNNAKWLYDLINRHKPVSEADQKWLQDIDAPAPIPTTAIYSKEDGIVPWQACMEKVVDEIHQNVRITGSHFGLGFNPQVWRIIENRLQYQVDNWRIYIDEGE